MAKEFTLTADQEYCKKTLAKLVRGDHHLGPVHPCGLGISIFWVQDASTYDFDFLTRLVLLAHRDGVRIGVEPSGRRELKLTAHRRNCKGGELRMSERHPNLRELIEMAESMEKT